jgi:hypothetical protein
MDTEARRYLPCRADALERHRADTVHSFILYLGY